MPTMPAQVTHLLQRLRDGERSALDELMPLMYGELHRVARAFMSRQQSGHTLQPTALVNEAYIRLFGGLDPKLADATFDVFERPAQDREYVVAVERLQVENSQARA